ncbi:MAG: 2-dehydropantoate 2-reductase [Burkholderiaceae bacterium]
MKIGIFGAGAIGGFFAARLARSGHAVSVLARGPTLAALRSRGLRLDSGGVSFTVQVHADDNAQALGAQDVVVLCVKAPSLEQVLPALTAMRTPDTVVVPALNGLPWWYFLGANGVLAGHRLKLVDSQGAIERAVPIASVLGCVVFPACSVAAPGHVVHASGNRIVLGEPAGGLSARAHSIAGTFRDAGFDAEASATIRQEIWLKLLGNACFNPVSLLTRSATDLLIDDPRVHALFAQMMHEALAVGAAIGIPVAIEPEQRLALTRRLGHIKTSMLQDAEAGKPVEIEAILGALVEVAAASEVPAPLLTAVYALARMHAISAGLLVPAATQGEG